MIEPKQLGPNERSGSSDGEHVIIVYVCPKCGDYYGHSSMGKLEDIPVIAPVTADDAGKIRHMRSRCSVCGENRIRRYARLIPQDEVADAERTIRARDATLIGDVVAPSKIPKRRNQ